MSGGLHAAVREATARLAAAGVPSPEVDAVALAAHVLRVGTAEVRRAMVLGDPAPDGYDELVAERARRVPLQHLTGRAGFRGIELRVGPGVFTPRPETEVVAGMAVEAARALAAGGERTPVVVDLCTGSGAIALAVKDEVPEADVHAVELSPEAYAWAVANRDALALEVDVRLGDATTAFADLAGTVDVVVSNPPYIPAGMEPVDPEVRAHEPSVSLYGGGDSGLSIPLAVAARAALLLRPGGRLLMEHADTQGETLPAGLRALGGWDDIGDHADLNGRPRVTSAVRATR